MPQPCRRESSHLPRDGRGPDGRRAHIELYIRHLGEDGSQVSSVNTMMHAVRGFFRFAHIDGRIHAAPAVYAGLPKKPLRRIAHPMTGPPRADPVLQVAQTLTVHQGAMAYLLDINTLRASGAPAVRREDYKETLRGYQVLHLVGKGAKPATMPLTDPILRVLEACRGQQAAGPLVFLPTSGKPIDRRDAYLMVLWNAKVTGILRRVSPHSLRHVVITNALDAGVTLRDAQILARHTNPPTYHRAPRPRPRQPRLPRPFTSSPRMWRESDPVRPCPE